MHFESPWAFLLLLLIPALAWARRRRRGGGAIRFSTTGNARRAGRSLRQRLAFVPSLLRALALACLIVALARPQRGLERVKDINKGIAIEMVADRSGSMSAEMEYEGERLNRLDAVKRVFKQFVMGNGRDLPGRPADLIGMIAFARYPDTMCPLTLAHGALPPFLESVRLAQTKAEDGTAIGDALALAAARLKTAEETLARQNLDPTRRKEYEIKSKVIILLTDGQSNCGKRSPQQAADLAAKWGIKVYTIGVGGGEAVTTIQTPFGAYKMPMGPGVDESTLAAIAKTTGGVYRRADDVKALHAVYKEIDELERSEIESVRYLDYKEEFAPLALSALVLIALQMALSATVFRKIP
jgi:Ca-activated chloride channel family protein